MRSVAYLPLVLLCACPDRPLGDSASGDPSTGTTGGTATATSPSTVSDTTPGTTSPTTGPATTGPVTTGPSTTTEPATTEPATSTTGTTGPSTSSPSSTATSDVSTGSDPSGTTDIKLDLPRFMEPPPGLVGCTLAAPPGTSIKGQTTLGQFTGNRAYFGALIDVGINVIGSPNLMILSPGADPETEFAEQNGFTGPIARDLIDTGLYDNWIGEWDFKGAVADKGMFASPAIKVTITQFAGNWDAPDPADPPRLVGTFAGDLSGPFDAVFCDKLNIEIISE